MIFTQFLFNVGSYCRLMYKVFSRPDNWKKFFYQLPVEMEKLGVKSLKIVMIISLFMGVIMTMQTKLNMENPWVPKFITGFVTRDSLLLEFSATILCIILAGKVGSFIASEIGPMKLSEQIDALEIMGVNSANYLILPKIIALVLMMPVIVVISICSGLFGGYLVGVFSNIISTSEYLYGIQHDFNPYYITYSIIKSLVFGFIIASVSSYYGYTVEGGSIELGKASTKAVVHSSVFILLANIILTNLLLV